MLLPIVSIKMLLRSINSPYVAKKLLGRFELKTLSCNKEAETGKSQQINYRTTAKQSR